MLYIDIYFYLYYNIFAKKNATYIKKEYIYYVQNDRNSFKRR